MEPPSAVIAATRPRAGVRPWASLRRIGSGRRVRCRSVRRVVASESEDRGGDAQNFVEKAESVPLRDAWPLMGPTVGSMARFSQIRPGREEARQRSSDCLIFRPSP